MIENELIKLKNLFKVIGDGTRIKILYMLSKSSMCVTELADSIKMTKSAISHQLKILKNNKLVTSKKSGKIVTYSLADECVYEILTVALTHIREKE